mmetsp:Transcript_117091/g.364600  ORF Transcript_117091/g.364600 Transcript_117091/m.364600 type:complete len:378 (+) Transcript_117091:255-1388(+)
MVGAPLAIVLEAAHVHVVQCHSLHKLQPQAHDALVQVAHGVAAAVVGCLVPSALQGALALHPPEDLPRDVGGAVVLEQVQRTHALLPAFPLQLRQPALGLAQHGGHVALPVLAQQALDLDDVPSGAGDGALLEDHLDDLIGLQVQVLDGHVGDVDAVEGVLHQLLYLGGGARRKVLNGGAGPVEKDAVDGTAIRKAREAHRRVGQEHGIRLELASLAALAALGGPALPPLGARLLPALLPLLPRHARLAALAALLRHAALALAALALAAGARLRLGPRFALRLGGREGGEVAVEGAHLAARLAARRTRLREAVLLLLVLAEVLGKQAVLVAAVDGAHGVNNHGGVLAGLLAPHVAGALRNGGGAPRPHADGHAGQPK